MGHTSSSSGNSSDMDAVVLYYQQILSNCRMMISQLAHLETLMVAELERQEADLAEIPKETS